MLKPSLCFAVATMAWGCFAPARNATAAGDTKPNPFLISALEIDALPSVRSAYDIIQRLRPTWLTRTRGTGISMSGTAVEGDAGPATAGGVIFVYVEYARIGEVRALGDVPASSVASIEFMDSVTANALLPGLSSTVIAGAIVIHLKTGR